MTSKAWNILQRKTNGKVSPENRLALAQSEPWRMKDPELIHKRHSESPQSSEGLEYGSFIQTQGQRVLSRSAICLDRELLELPEKCSTGMAGDKQKCLHNYISFYDEIIRMMNSVLIPEKAWFSLSE